MSNVYIILGIIFTLGWTSARSEESDHQVTQLNDQLNKAEWSLLDDPQEAFTTITQIRANFNSSDYPELWLRSSNILITSLVYLGKFDEVESLLDEAFALTKQYELTQSILPLWIQKARFLEFTGRSQEALSLLKEIESELDENTSKRTQANLYTNLANFSLKYKNDSEAARYIQKAYDAIKDTNKDYAYYAVLNNIGTAYMKASSENKDRIIAIFEDISNFTHKEGMRFLGILASYNLGICLNDVGRFAEAYEAFEKSLKHAEKMDDRHSVAYGKFGIGLSLLGLQRYQDALPELLSSLQIFEQQKNDHAAFENRLELAHAYLKLGKLDLARHYIQLVKLDPLMKDALAPEIVLAGYEAELLTKMGELKEAIQRYQKLVELMKEGEKKRNSELMNKYNAQFELERREQANKALEQENRIQALELESSRRSSYIKTLVIGLIGIILIAMSLVYWRIRRHNLEIQALHKYIEKNILQRFLPPVIVQEILEGKSRLDDTAKMETVTILFADLCDFTKATYELGPHLISEILNDFFLHMSDVIFDTGGTIDKFIGDAIMVIFGAPTTMSVQEQAQRAVICARRMQETLMQRNEHWEKLAGHQFTMRIGIHQGPGVVGSFGGSKRSDYTVIGNSVNIAARIEELAESQDILFSQSIAQHLESDSYQYRGSYMIRGLKEVMDIYEALPSLNKQRAQNFYLSIG